MPSFDPPANLPSPIRRTRVWWVMALAVVIGVVVLIGSRLHRRDQDVSPDQPAGEHSQMADPGYVGVQACRDCHRQRVDEYVATKHFRTCRELAPAEWADRFAAGNNVYRTQNPDLWFEMTREGERFFQTSITKRKSGEERRREQIALVYGAGTVDEIFHYWKDSRLYQMPVAYLNPIQAWGNSPGFMDGTAHFSRKTLPRCLECHNTSIHHVPGTENEYRIEQFVPGISCERCHGPGRDHVNYHVTHPDAEETKHIVKPYELSRTQQLDLCSQCHGNTANRKTPPFSFRPGDSLEDHFRIGSSKYPENDHTANHNLYLSQSKCFQASSMTCVTCHNPHIPEGDGHDNAGSAENSCFICHESHDCGERPRLPESVQDRCIDCHMPRRMSINIWFATATNEYRPLLERRRHRIDVYPDATKQVLLDWYRHQDDAQSRLLADRLTQELFAQRVEEAEALRRDKRLFPASVAYREALQLRRSSEIEKKLSELMAALRQVDEAFEEAMTSINENRAGDAMRALERLLVIKPNDAQARGKLGLLLAENGQADEALSQLEIVTRYDPDSADGHVITGRIHYWQGRFHQAVDDYEKAAEKKPYDSLIHFELGSVLWKLQRFDDADRHLRRAIEINPNNDDAIQMLKRTLQTKRR